MGIFNNCRMRVSFLYDKVFAAAHCKNTQISYRTPWQIQQAPWPAVRARCDTQDTRHCDSTQAQGSQWFNNNVGAHVSIRNFSSYTKVLKKCNEKRKTIGQNDVTFFFCFSQFSLCRNPGCRAMLPRTLLPRPHPLKTRLQRVLTWS